MVASFGILGANETLEKGSNTISWRSKQDKNSVVSYLNSFQTNLIIILKDDPIKVEAPAPEHEGSLNILFHKQIYISDSALGDIDDVKGLKRNIA